MDKFDKRIHRSNQLLIAASILLFLVGVAQWAKAQNVGINGDGSSPESNTMLDIKSTGNTSVTFGLKVKDSGANDQFVVRSDGNVGIGTTSPVSPIHTFALNGNAGIFSGINAGTLIANSPGINLYNRNASVNNWTGIGFGDTDGQAVVAKVAAQFKDVTNNYGDLGFATRGTDGILERVRITQTGNLGIGTTTPKNKLDVEGGAVIGTTYSGTNTAPTNGLLVQGNVGIGTTSPSESLDVSGNFRLGDPTGASHTIINIDAPAGHKRFIRFRSGTADRWLIETNEVAESGGNAGSDFNIWRYDDAGATLGTVFRITRSTGNANFVYNLGVGAIVPRSRLHVNGGDINVESIGSGVIIKSPDSSCWRVTVDNRGNLVTTSITCP